MNQYLGLIIIFTATFLYLTLKQKNTKKIFIEITKDHFRPACIINKTTKKITWKNEQFTKYFATISKENNFSNLNLNVFFNKMNIENNGINWFVENFDLKSEKGLLFSPIEKLDPYTFLELPFAILILNKNNKIIRTNDTLENLISIDHYKKDQKLIKLILEQAKTSKDIIWYTKEGLQPIKTSVKILNDEKIIFLENNLDNIKLKRQVQESQHLQILGQLTSSIIHDFKNLLTSICGFADSLSEEIPNDPSLKNIQQNIEQAANLLQELLNFIKSKPIENATIEPKNSLSKISSIIKSLLGGKIKLETNISTSGYIKMSDTQLERILFNMVLNSKDAMKDGGIFKINTSKKTFDQPFSYQENKQLAPGTYYIIEVSDTGAGIPLENSHKIFNQFFTTKEKGTGLGLTSSLSLTEHCGGGMTFSSSPKGTTFFIMLPYIEKKEEIHDPKAINKNQESYNNKTLILVEDEEMIRNIVKKTFSQEGLNVLDFDNGTDALKEIQKMNFDYLITDAVLPGVDGTKLANEAYRLKPDSKIFLVSGYDFETLKTNLTAKLQYISKPFTTKSLKQIVLKK